MAMGFHCIKIMQYIDSSTKCICCHKIALGQAGRGGGRDKR